jgi:hypothetical protein
MMADAQIASKVIQSFRRFEPKEFVNFERSVFICCGSCYDTHRPASTVWQTLLLHILLIDLMVYVAMACSVEICSRHCSNAISLGD